mmetsp:Transcript_147845/g.474613  ORF Transcript_147845/g.474613 Transcript_147845/m.474613 type:complete len:272 (+) Transcript_147845:306-1121(+)
MQRNPGVMAGAGSEEAPSMSLSCALNLHAALKGSSKPHSTLPTEGCAPPASLSATNSPAAARRASRPETSRPSTPHSSAAATPPEDAPPAAVAASGAAGTSCRGSPISTEPSSTRPRTSDTLPLRSRSVIRTRKGPVDERSGKAAAWMASNNEPPKYQPAQASHSSSSLQMFAQAVALTGTKEISSSRKPRPRRAGNTSARTSSKRAWSHLVWPSPSILLTATTTLSKPALLAKTACSRVCPPFASPASSSLAFADTTSTAISACAAAIHV